MSERPPDSPPQVSVRKAVPNYARRPADQYAIATRRDGEADVRSVYRHQSPRMAAGAVAGPVDALINPISIGLCETTKAICGRIFTPALPDWPLQ